VSDPERLEARLSALERRLRQIEFNQRTLDVHVTAIENSIVFRLLRYVGRPLLDARTKLSRWLMRTPLPRISRRLSSPGPDPYQAWMEQEAETELPPLTASPRFSILLPLVKPRRENLETTIASVRAQSYPSWELCIAADASAEPWVREFLAAAARSEPRIHLAGVSGGAQTGVLWNETARLATGDYLAPLGEFDSLAPDALHWIASEAPADVIYSDEDQSDEGGKRFEPIFKPGWSPDLLLSCMYIGHLTAFSRSAFERSGGFRPEHAGAAVYDLALRITDGAVSVRHVPRILYHARKDGHDIPVRNTSAAVRRVLEDTIRRRGLPAEVDDGPRPDSYQLRWKPVGSALASLIVCSRSPGLLDRCLRALAAGTAYPHRELIVIQHLGLDDAALQGVIERHGATRIPYSGPFHFARMNNLGAQAAQGEVLVFLNDDTEPLEPSWLERLVAQVERPGVGIAGAQLLYPSGSLQHGGVVIGISDGCGHIGRGAYGSRFWPWIESTRDVAAVTGACLAIRAPMFRGLGGFADEFPLNYNDTDLCLRARAAGYRVIYEAGAKLRHYECQTRRGVVTFRERERWYSRWGELIDAGDPFYSPHLTQEREDLSLRLVSRT